MKKNYAWVTKHEIEIDEIAFAKICEIYQKSRYLVNLGAYTDDEVWEDAIAEVLWASDEIPEHLRPLIIQDCRIFYSENY